MEERLGSYSILSTMPTDEVVRFRSTLRCSLLDPPPRCQIVMRPAEFRPDEAPPDDINSFLQGFVMFFQFIVTEFLGVGKCDLKPKLQGVPDLTFE